MLLREENSFKGERPQILFAESHPALRDVLARLIELAGHCDIITARNGLESIEKARRLQPDLILAGLRMPVMDGFTVIRVLRSDPGTVDIPIIVLSTWSDAKSWQRAVAAGANEYLILPVEIDRLVGKINKYLAHCH